MKLASLIDEKLGLPDNLRREFGERYVRDFINPGKFAELWTAFESTYPDLQPQLKATFEKTNDLFKYIKPEKGGESYRVSTLPEAAAQELDNYLDNILAAIDELSNLDKAPDEKTVSDAIQYFDGLFQDMLNIFTSNTAGDAPLEPYKKTNIGFGSSLYKEGKEDLYDILKSKRHDINVDFGPRTYSMLQQQMMLGNEGYVRDWMEKNAFIEQQDDWPPKDKALSEKIREVIKNEIRKIGEDVLGSSNPIGLSDLPADLAKTAANKGSGRAPDAVYAGPGGDDAQNLKPSQQQIILVKAFNMAMNTTPAGGKFEPGGDIGAIISKDNFIMDGHHRWASTILVKPDASIKGEKIGLPAKDLITALNVYTKGVIGKQSGNPGQGAISQFTGENIQSNIIDVAEKTGKSPDHPDAPGYKWEDLKQRIAKVGGGDYQTGLDFIKTNANIVSSKKIESWMPDRDDMPVIQKDQLPDVEKKFASGELDLKPPFDPATKSQMKKAGLGGDDSEPDVQTKRQAKLRTALKEFYNLS